jgi:long-chain acyl-CoA synthetase
VTDQIIGAARIAAPAESGFVAPDGPVDAMLRTSALRNPNGVAFRHGSRTLTYRTLDNLADRYARLLRALTGSRPAVVALTSVLAPEFAVGYYGVLRSGNIAAPINPFLREEQLVLVLGDSGAELAFVDAVVAQRIHAVRDQLPALRYVVVVGPYQDSLPESVRTLREMLAEVRDSGAATDTAADSDRAPAPDDVACLHFTSGTTGAPKTVMLSHRNVAVNAAQVAHAQRLTGDSVMLNHLPTFHPMHLNAAVFAGAAQILCAEPDPLASLRLANETRATHYYSLPARLVGLAGSERLAEARLETVRMIASGGSALPIGAAHRLAGHFGIPVIQGYGLAETSPLTHFDDPDDPAPGTVGRPVPATEHRIVEVRTREVLGTGEAGEVQVRGPQVMRGYAGEAAPSVVDARGWLSTGDIGQIGADGRLVLLDRLKDVFKRDNWLVSPSSVEHSVRQHPEVRDCVVVDVPDPVCGAVATAFVVLAVGAAESLGGPTTAAARLAEQVNATMPYYQRLEHVEVVPAVSRSANGKVPRRELRARMAELLRRTSAAAPEQHYQTPHTTTSQEAPAVINFITTFTLKGETDAAEFERLFKEHADFMSAQPGFVGYRMLRATANPATYVNIGVWADADAHRAVLGSETFAEHVRALAPLVDVTADFFTEISAAELSV